MRNGAIVLVAAALAVASGRGSAGDRKADASGHQGFTGSWDLQPEESDDPHAKMKEAMGDRRGRGPGGGGPGGGGPMGGPMGGGPGGGGPMSGGPVGERGSPGGFGPGMGGPPPREQMEAMREAMDDALRSAQSLLISQDGVSFEVVSDGERVMRLYADGRKNKGSSGIERKTRWEADKLVTEARLGGGFGPSVKITETWALVPRGATADAKAPKATLEVATRDKGAAAPSAASATPGAPPADVRHLSVTTRLSGGFFDKDVVMRRVYARTALP